MTTRELLQNLINQFTKPFTIEIATNLTGTDSKEVAALIPDFLKAGQIKRISETEEIFVRCHRYNLKLGTPHYRNWVFDITAANQLLNIIDQGKYSRIRPIAQAIGKSRKWVYIYLEALASIGVVDYRNYRYVVVNRKHLYKIGTKVQKGILCILLNMNKRGIQRIL